MEIKKKYFVAHNSFGGPYYKEHYLSFDPVGKVFEKEIDAIEYCVECSGYQLASAKINFQEWADVLKKFKQVNKE